MDPQNQQHESTSQSSTSDHSRPPQGSHRTRHTLSASQLSSPQSPPPALSPSLLFPSQSSRAESRRRQGRRKLHKRPPEYLPNMDFPERLRQKEGDEEHEETVRPFGLGLGNRNFANMSTNILGLLSATNPKVDHHNRFAGYSSEEDANDSDEGNTGHKKVDDAASDPMAQTMILSKPGSKRRKRSTGHKLMQSVPILSRLSSRKSKKEGKQPELNIQEEAEAESESSADENRLAPHMSRILEARAEVESRPSFDLELRATRKEQDSNDHAGGSPTDLTKRLQEIFGFEEPEEVISEYPCYLLQVVLLQGFIYITSKHICFYAYLPKKAHATTKSGSLAKAGKRNPRYSRYWFQLKGDVLSYYEGTTTANKYFPHGQIDLRYGITASLADKDKEGLHFTLETDHRTYYFRADTSHSAKDWVNSLQRVIFRSRNEGDSVKISLPIRNVIDIEEIKMLDLETCKLRVIDNDETYAVDEYFFSFFKYGQDAISILKILIEDEQGRDDEPGALDIPPTVDEASASGPTSPRSSFARARAKHASPATIRTGRIDEKVRATLSPLSPKSSVGLSPRASGDYPRSSFDAIRQIGRRSTDHPHAGVPPRRSFSQDRHRSVSGRRYGDERHASTHSTSESTDDPSIASLSGMTTSGELDASASQILRGSDVFHSPTVHRSHSTDGEEREPRSSRRDSSHRPKHAATTGHLADSTAGEKFDTMPPTPTLDMISKMGSYPLQRVGAFADYLNRSTKRVGGLLTTESTGLAGRVSGMWKGGQKHYDATGASEHEDSLRDTEQNRVDEERFQAHFALPKNERLKATYFGYFVRVLPLYGKFYVSERTICFRSLLPGTRTKLILPIEDIENVSKSSGFRLGYSGLVVMIRRHEELFFEFGDAEHRDNLAISLHRSIESRAFMQGSDNTGGPEDEEAEKAVAEQRALEAARQEEFPEHEPDFQFRKSSSSEGATIAFDDAKVSLLDFKPKKPLHFTCLTIGSRGDVQPYIALCKGLIAEGHKARIATHSEFKDWIEGHGIEFRTVEGDPAELMKLCIENGTFTVAFLQKANATMRTWLDGLLTTSWTACKGTDVLIESPSAMAGIHIAERLRIPYFRAFGMPWTRTRTYPHAFLTPEHKLGGSFNIATYAMFDLVFWQGTARQINNWRKSTLTLPSTNLSRLRPNKVPFLYNFSPEVVPPPMDFSDWIRVTGYWFLDEGGKNWTPPAELVAFINKARVDGKKLVYVGFGSIILDNPAKFTREIIDAVLKADVRCILSKGWSDRLDANASANPVSSQAQIQDALGEKGFGKEVKHAESSEVPLPPEIFAIKSAPHDWLFNQIDAAAHHGGSGTTGASLRAGIPTIVRPFFGDQFFFGGRVEDLGVGILLRRWGAKSFARALWEATNSERMIVKARSLGERIRKENGVDTAIQDIYRNLQYATDLIESKADQNGSVSEGEEAEDEEEWTFIGDGDHDLALDDEAAELSSSRRLPSESVIWTASEPSGHRSPRVGRSSSYKSTGSGNDHMATKQRGR